MKNKFLFFIIFLFIISCANNKTTIKKDIYTGTDGAILEFFSNFPEYVYEQEDLNYIIKVINKGPYHVTNSKLLISLEKGYMSFSDGSNVNEIKNIKLEGKTLINDINDFSVIEKIIKVKKIDKQSEYHNSQILTNFCYDYGGIAIKDVCIDTDPYNIKATKKSCVSEPLSFSDGQGGPLVISLVETKMLTEGNYLRPQFKINFQNKGQGVVIKKDSVDLVCSNQKLSEEVYNGIYLKDISFSYFHKNDFECYPEKLALKNDQDSIICTLKPGLHSRDIPSYLTPLKIEIEYGYFLTYSQPIKIKKILKY